MKFYRWPPLYFIVGFLLAFCATVADVTTPVLLAMYLLGVILFAGGAHFLGLL